jgi:hypothetical protein
MNTRASISLPRSEPVHFLAGHGQGSYCAECGSVITRQDLQYEIEWAEPVRTLRMHARCYEMWHTDRQAAVRPPVS